MCIVFPHLFSPSSRFFLIFFFCVRCHDVIMPSFVLLCSPLWLFPLLLCLLCRDFMASCSRYSCTGLNMSSMLHVFACSPFSSYSRVLFLSYFILSFHFLLFLFSFLFFFSLFLSFYLSFLFFPFLFYSRVLCPSFSCLFMSSFCFVTLLLFSCFSYPLFVFVSSYLYVSVSSCSISVSSCSSLSVSLCPRFFAFHFIILSPRSFLMSSCP